MHSTSLFLLIVGVSLSLAVPTVKLPNGLRGQELVDQINKDGQWKAALHPRFTGKTIEQIRGHLGAIRKPRQKKLPEKFKNSYEHIPASFDARINWPQCADVVGHIYDQSICSNSWAVSAAATMSDHLCIATNGTNKTPISAIDITSCCKDCGNCKGGDTYEAFDWIYTHGISSGSDYSTDSYCKPYPFAPCEHNNKTAYQTCEDVANTLQCSKSCQKGYKDRTYSQDKFYSHGIVLTWINVKEIQRVIMAYGSTTATFDVYEDFLYYQSGVYQHNTGKDKPIGSLAVRMIGWGTENGVDYWLLANQWNSDWGDKGLGKFIRGIDNCGVESYVVTGQIDTSRLPK
ncbi:Cathepsin B-like cysteine protease 2 [Aphelenchoides besseyi]|nr:Cathepsin B-like cysteine protease 2 [Aphelenchoides besseyi]